MFSPDRRWIRRFTNVTREALRRFECKPNVCIEAARIGVGVAQAFGFVAEPVPVAVKVVAGLQATVLPGPGREGRRQSGFDGHLVLHFAGGAFVDLTADQFHSPARGILVPGPIVVEEVPRAGLASGWMFTDLPSGTRMAYRELVGDVSWRSVPAWTESAEIPIRVVVRQLRAALAAR